MVIESKGPSSWIGWPCHFFACDFGCFGWVLPTVLCVLQGLFSAVPAFAVFAFLLLRLPQYRASVPLYTFLRPYRTPFVDIGGLNTYAVSKKKKKTKTTI